MMKWQVRGRAMSLALVAGLMVFLPFAALAEEAYLPPIEDDQFILIHAPDHQLVCKYHFQKVAFKPYVQELYSPAGFNVVRDAVPDHIHHHGLMFAVAVDGVDFWAEIEGCGKEVHQQSLGRFYKATPGFWQGGFNEKLDWVSPKNETILKEDRKIQVRSMDAPVPVTFLIWRSNLEAPPNKESATLTGSHYFGLGMRFPQSMDGIGQFTNAGSDPGELVRGEERNVQSEWCAYTAEPGGKPVTVAMFGHPSNIRPTTWFTMPRAFAYMSATLNLHKEPLKINAGKPLNLAYAVAIWDKKATKEEINKLYEKWIALSLDEGN